MIITNFKNLAKSPFRKKALQIIEAGYEAINIDKVINKKIKLDSGKLIISNAMMHHSVNLNKYKNIYLVGIGKGSALASAALAKILGKKLTKGIAIDVVKPETWNLKLETFVGTHPMPSTQNIKAAKKIIELAEKAGKDDLIISFICGGGSALFCGSEKELKASREIFGKLTAAGANIVELNTIRKHLSEVKGGGLAKIAYPATIISLVVSDVLGDNVPMVASGPTVYDKTTKKDAEKILANYKLRIANYELFETPKNKKYFKKVKNILFLSNREPVNAMAKKAKQLGFLPKIYSYELDGESRKSLLPLAEAVKKGAVMVAGGETIIKLGKNPGKGGRNTEAVLGALQYATSNKRQATGFIFASFASDGKDNVDVAGAMGDTLTINKAQKLKLDVEKYLKNHNTFEFFKKTGDLIFIDKKTFNVSDLMLVLGSSKE